MLGPESDALSRQESEQELCQECMKYSYIPSGGIGATEDPNVLWIECGKCLKWYHAPCKGVDQSQFDVEKEWYCCQVNEE